MAVDSDAQLGSNSSPTVWKASAKTNGETVFSSVQNGENSETELPTSIDGNIVNGTDASGSHETKLGQPSRFNTVGSYPESDLKLEDRFIDDFRPLRVAVIGAGLSGILSGILLPAKLPNVQLTIFEKNKDVVSAGLVERSLALLFLNTLRFTVQPFIPLFSLLWRGQDMLMLDNRAELGLKTSIQGCDAIFHLMSTRRPSPQTCNGPSNLLQEPKF